MRDALVPKKAANLGEVIMRISDWENKITELERLDPMYKLQPMMKTALITEICPGEVKDMIFQNMDGATQPTYQAIRDKVISWVSNRVDNNYAVSMDVGALTDEFRVEWPREDYDWHPCEMEVNMMG